jgi:hypothetical protein
MKKLINLLLVLFLASSLVGCSDNTTTIETTTETTTLNFVINNVEEGTELFNRSVKVSGTVETLEDFLEVQDQFEVVMEVGEYGSLITSLAGAAQDSANGPWWVYESDNNAQCLEAGYCDAASSLKITDGDNFTFNLTSSFE